jgi:hypothetical protein
MDPPLFDVGFAGGAVRSARTEDGAGSGWTALVNLGLGSLDPPPATPKGERSWRTFRELVMQYELSRSEFADTGAEVWRFSLGPLLHERGGVLMLHWGVYWDGEGGWGLGPRIGCGLRAFNRRVEAALLATAYAWLGERDDGFDVGAEADLQFCLGLRF